jgi:osmotically inducible protein OsmC
MGAFTAGDSISGGFTYKSRFEGGEGSNPEQLLGAAHASRYSGTPAEGIHTDAEVAIRLVEGLPTITKIDLVTVGSVPGLDEVSFVDHALTAKATCPLSRALAAVPEINLKATLE